MLPEEYPLTPENIRKLLEAAGYNQTTGAPVLNVEQGTISRWWSGKLKPNAKAFASLRALKPLDTRRTEWNTFLAEVAATVAAIKAKVANPTADADALAATLGPALGPHLPKVDADELADKVAAKTKVDADELADKVAAKTKVDADELADKVAAKTKVDADELALNLAEVLPGKEEIAAHSGKATVELKKHTEEQTGKATVELKKHTEEQIGKATIELKKHTEEQTGKATAEVNAHTDGQTREQQRTVVSESRKSRRQMAGCAVGLAVLILGSQHFARPSMVVNMNGVSVEQAQHTAPNAPPAWLKLPAPATPTPTGARARAGRPVPKEPFKGQMRPPCGPFRAINGGCWLSGNDENYNAIRAPCPEDMYESASYCFLPIGERGERLPSSLDGDP